MKMAESSSAKEEEKKFLYQKRYDKYNRMHIDEILPGLYISGCNPAEKDEILDSRGITHVVNMASYFDNPFPDKYKYYRIDEEDLDDTNLRKHFIPTFKFIDEGRKKGKVLVHCNAGISRAGTMVTAYVMKTKALRRDEAMEFAQSKRNNPIDPNDGFLKQLLEFEKTLIKENVIKESK